MKKSQIAAQCYTLREHMHTPASVDRAFAKVRQIGFEAVQISGTGVAPAEIKKYADLNGLQIVATHESADNILGNPDAVIEKLELYNCKHTAFPCPADWQVVNYDAVIELAQGLEASAVKLAEAGKTLSYHNHNIEFRKLNNEYILDILCANAPHLKLEIDTYWVQMGGCDPTEYIKKYAGRQDIFHLKDFGVIYPRTSIMVPVGTGNLKWHEILPAAEQSGVEWFIIEQDSCQKDQFESLKDSYDYLVANFTE